MEIGLGASRADRWADWTVWMVASRPLGSARAASGGDTQRPDPGRGQLRGRGRPKWLLGRVWQADRSCGREMRAGLGRRTAGEGRRTSHAEIMQAGRPGRQRGKADRTGGDRPGRTGRQRGKADRTGGDQLDRQLGRRQGRTDDRTRPTTGLDRRPDRADAQTVDRSAL